MSTKLKNKVVVVTGGTKGVGKGVVLESARQGATVIIAGRDQRAAQKIQDQSVNFDGDVHFIQTDLASSNQCKVLFGETFQRFGRVDGFFSYAGITPASDLLQFDEEHVDQMLDINVKGVLFCCQSAVKYMMQSGGGSIILTGSPHAWGGDKDRIVYACSKGTMLTLTHHIAKHYAVHGIRANNLTMGWTPTEGEVELRKSQGMTEEQLRDWAATIIPAGRMIEIDDLVPGIIFLLSDDSKMVSGSNFRITGGWYL